MSSCSWTKEACEGPRSSPQPASSRTRSRAGRRRTGGGVCINRVYREMPPCGSCSARRHSCCMKRAGRSAVGALPHLAAGEDLTLVGCAVVDVDEVVTLGDLAEADFAGVEPAHEGIALHAAHRREGKQALPVGTAGSLEDCGQVVRALLDAHQGDDQLDTTVDTLDHVQVPLTPLASTGKIP